MMFMDAEGNASGDPPPGHPMEHRSCLQGPVSTMASKPQRALVREWLMVQDDLSATFAELDLDGNGFVTLGECWRSTRNRELCAALLAMADGDGDGKISLTEFLQLGQVLQDVVRRA